MPALKVLVEIAQPRDDSFQRFEAAATSGAEAARQADELVSSLAGLSLDPDEEAVPVPLLSRERDLPSEARTTLRAFSGPQENPDVPGATTVVACEVERDRLEELEARDGIVVWPNSEIVLLSPHHVDHTAVAGGVPVDGQPAIDAARSRVGVDCRPFRRGVDVATIRDLLGVEVAWREGFRGQNVTVGILDSGIDGSVYPVSGGFSRPGAQQPGTASTTSHGSMCAADVLVAAPWARLYDYPFLGVPRSGGALAMFQAVLDQRRRTGTPHITNNSWGFVAVPPRASAPHHEIHDLNHPLHRKVREVVASGAATFFAAGNCGQDCPSGACHASGIGPDQSIHAANSLEEVITIAAVNSRHERIGYSSQGEGMFEPRKPDLAAYSHFFGNFGPGRPGGTEQPFDNGTSAAAPLAAGVAALLLSAFDDLAPEQLAEALVEGAVRVHGEEWDRDYGRGIVNAAASYTRLRRAAG